MDQKSLKRSEYRVLERIYNHLRRTGKNVRSTDNWLWKEVHISRQGISNYIKGCTEKGYLNKREDKSLIPTKLATDLFTSSQSDISIIDPFSPAPVVLRVRGQVRAGQASPEELEVDLDEYDEPGGKSIPIPAIDAESKTYALQVVGNSMEHEGIFEGDYVIVQEFKEYQFPKENQLIVTYYILYQEDGSDYHDGFNELMGPTVKYFREMQNKDGRKIYRLSWKKDALSNPEPILASDVKPIGKIIGVYRTFQK